MSKVFIANWKMFGALGIAQDLFSVAAKLNQKNISLMVPSPYMFLAQRYLQKTQVSWGGQTMRAEESGAFTGDLSPLMLKEFGCSKVLLGHSERRKYWMESDAFIADAACSAIEHDIVPIICVGEPIAIRKSSKHIAYVTEQLKKSIAKVDGGEFIVAYEPVWAIGTGLQAHCEQISEMYEHLLQVALEFSGSCSIIYGGSIKASNIEEVLSCVDGVLVGGASLDKQQFIDMVDICKQ